MNWKTNFISWDLGAFGKGVDDVTRKGFIVEASLWIAQFFMLFVFFLDPRRGCWSALFSITTSSLCASLEATHSGEKGQGVKSPKNNDVLSVDERLIWLEEWVWSCRLLRRFDCPVEPMHSRIYGMIAVIFTLSRWASAWVETPGIRCAETWNH